MRPYLGKMRPIWVICTKSGQKCSRVGGKKFNHGSGLVLYAMVERFQVSLAAEWFSGLRANFAIGFFQNRAKNNFNSLWTPRTMTNRMALGNLMTILVLDSTMSIVKRNFIA